MGRSGTLVRAALALPAAFLPPASAGPVSSPIPASAAGTGSSLAVASPERAVPSSGGGAAAALQELDRRLAELGSPSGEARSRAERWLAAHVGRDDYPALARTALEGDAEVRGRLARALGSDDRHLALAVAFLAGEDDALAAIGSDALRDLVLRWNERLGEPGRGETELRGELFELARRSVPRLLRVDATRPLDDTLDLVRRFGELPLALVREPGLRAGPGGRIDAVGSGPADRILVGRWDELVLGLARRHGVGLEGHGLPEDPERRSGPRGFLRFAPTREVGSLSGVELVERWCRRFADPSESPERRRELARSLAASGWPAALGWLASRHAAGDEAALEGLLLAAGEGGVEPTLLSAATVRALLARATADLEAGTPEALTRSHRVLVALRHFGCVDPSGALLVPAVLEDWSSSTTRGRWLRIAVLQGLGCGSDPATLSKLRDVLADASAPVALRWRALAAWGRLVSPLATEAPRLAEARSLLEAIEDERRGRELLEHLIRARIAPPDDLREADASLGSLARAVLAVWWMESGDPDTAARHLAALLRPPEPAGLPRSMAALTYLRDALLRGRNAALGAAFAAALERAEGEPWKDAVRRLAFLTGPPGPELRDALGVAPGGLAAEHPVVLGVWIGLGEAQTSEEALGILLERLRTALAGPDDAASHGDLLAGFERALAELFARGADLGGEILVARLGRAIDEAPSGSPLARELSLLRWPHPPRTELVPLHEVEHPSDPRWPR